MMVVVCDYILPKSANADCPTWAGLLGKPEREISGLTCSNTPSYKYNIYYIYYMLSFLYQALLVSSIHQVVWKVDSAIHQITHYSVDKLMLLSNKVIHWIRIYPTVSAIHLSYNWSQFVKCHNKYIHDRLDFNFMSNLCWRCLSLSGGSNTVRNSTWFFQISKLYSPDCFFEVTNKSSERT